MKFKFFNKIDKKREKKLMEDYKNGKILQVNNNVDNKDFFNKMDCLNNEQK